MNQNQNQNQKPDRNGPCLASASTRDEQPCPFFHRIIIIIISHQQAQLSDKYITHHTYRKGLHERRRRSCPRNSNISKINRNKKTKIHIIHHHSSSIKPSTVNQRLNRDAGIHSRAVRLATLTTSLSGHLIIIPQIPSHVNVWDKQLFRGAHKLHTGRIPQLSLLSPHRRNG